MANGNPLIGGHVNVFLRCILNRCSTGKFGHFKMAKPFQKHGLAFEMAKGFKMASNLTIYVPTLSAISKLDTFTMSYSKGILCFICEVIISLSQLLTVLKNGFFFSSYSCA